MKIEDGEIRRSNSPQEFIPASHNTEKQIVTKENDIFSQKQKIKFRRFNFLGDNIFIVLVLYCT